ncbi:recombinase family protein, partial [Anaerosporobacter sp.]
MNTAAIYIRVSTEDQTDYSPDAQKRLISTYANQHNLVVPKEYIFIDEGISGRRADKRPAFMQMIRIAKKKPRPFDVILVHKFDRFSRSREDSILYK